MNLAYSISYGIAIYYLAFAQQNTIQAFNNTLNVQVANNLSTS